MYTLRQPVEYAAIAFADRTATVFRSNDGGVRRELTYREFADRVRRIRTLIETLTEPGDRVVLWAHNSDFYLQLFIAVPASGRTIVPLNTKWAEPEVLYATTDAEATILLCDRDPGAVGTVVDDVIRLDTDNFENRLAAVDSHVEISHSKEMPLNGDDAVELTPDSLAGLFYTGGTTGKSKGVMLTHQNLMANAIQTQLGQPLATDDRYLTIAPMFHAAGVYCAVSAMLVGAANVIVEAFTPEVALDTIADEHITCLIAVPTMMAAMNEVQDIAPRDVSTLRWMSHGASPVTSEVLRRTDRLFRCELIHLYGATETSPIATILRHEETLLDDDRSKSAGLPAPGVEIRIDAPDERGPGEVMIRGANVMVGYWHQPEQTATVLSENGWYRSGDVGYLDDSYLFLVDRAKDMIVSGGENVYCTEVEDALYSHPAILEATVFGIPDDRWGELVHAIVVRRDGRTVDETELIEHCRSQIAGYKIPKSIEFSDEPLPKSGPGKVLKRELRAPYWAGHDRAIN